MPYLRFDIGFSLCYKFLLMIQVITIGLSAFLLFLLQPMISKIILPDFGGGSSIWLTSLIFYQLLLLAGYSFSHLLVSKAKPIRQALIYAGLIALSLLFIPIQIHFRQADITPVLHIFLLLLASIGLPYFLLSTTSPMVQYWIAASDTARKRNPYVLYAVSNTGSLAGLLCYPTIIEPNLANSRQMILLSYGFCIYAFLVFVCLVIYLKRKPAAKAPAFPNPGQHEPVSGRSRLTWLGLAMLPAAALMVFTHHLTVDIVNFPLLWVIPLSLYLISFVVVFLKPGVSRPGLVRTLLILIPILAMVLALRSELNIPFTWKIAATCACLFAICMFFHGSLERSKPAPQKLTAFYLYLSLGACLGSTLAGIVAPLVFKSTFELYIVLIVSLYLILLPYFLQRKKSLKVYFQIAAALLLLLSFYNEEISHHHHIVYKTRSFYGTYTIRDLPQIPGQKIAARMLSHGTTIHGGQAKDIHGRLMPISYFHEQSGVGQAFLSIPELKDVGVVGLGTGMVSLYARRGQTFDFFEIDATVVDIAKNHFENLDTSPAVIHHIIGDARLELQKIPDDCYDMLVLDAFTSGAIPTHLLTIEAVREYLRVLRADGLILFHITNRYVDLMPVLNCAAEELGLFIKHHRSREDKANRHFAAHWAILTKSEALLARVTAGKPDWKEPAQKRVCWSDDFSNLWSIISLAE